MMRLVVGCVACVQKGYRRWSGGPQVMYAVAACARPRICTHTSEALRPESGWDVWAFGGRFDAMRQCCGVLIYCLQVHFK